MKPALIYDATCPICSKYQSFVKKKLGDRIEYIPGDPKASEVHYRDAVGKTYSGVHAIDKLVVDFPEVKDLMFLLPPNLRAAGIKAVYKVSSVVRKSVGKVKGGCNCGRKKK